jgi:uroporphyrinogen-III decarboxylase
MDLSIEKEWMLKNMGIAESEVDSYHFSSAPSEDDIESQKAKLKQAPTPKLKAVCGALEYTGKIPGLIPVGMAIGPFSLLVKLLSDPITGVYLAGSGITAEEDEDVNIIEKALEISVETILHSIKLQIEAGAKAICVCEPAANTVYISPIQMKDDSSVFDKLIMEPNKRIRKLLAETDTDLIFHDCGELTDAMLEKFNELDPAILSLGGSRKLWEDVSKISKNTVLFGNLPSKNFYSDEEMPCSKVAGMTIDLDKKMKETGHPFILASECDILYVSGAVDSIRKKIDVMLTAGKH